MLGAAIAVGGLLAAWVLSYWLTWWLESERADSWEGRRDDDD